jgi:hypothetical protein
VNFSNTQVLAIDTHLNVSSGDAIIVDLRSFHGVTTASQTPDFFIYWVLDVNRPSLKFTGLAGFYPTCDSSASVSQTVSCGIAPAMALLVSALCFSSTLIPFVPVPYVISSPIAAVSKSRVFLQGIHFGLVDGSSTTITIGGVVCGSQIMVSPGTLISCVPVARFVSACLCLVSSLLSLSLSISLSLSLSMDGCVG